MENVQILNVSWHGGMVAIAAMVVVDFPGSPLSQFHGEMIVNKEADGSKSIFLRHFGFQSAATTIVWADFIAQNEAAIIAEIEAAFSAKSIELNQTYEKISNDFGYNGFELNGEDYPENE